MEVNNTFDNGMNSDASNLRQPLNTYPKAINFRPVTDAGSSTLALTNIRGNECAITFPTLRGVYKLQIKEHPTGNFTGVINITINGQTTSNITIDTGTKTSDIAVYILGLTNCYNNPTAINPTFAIAYDDESIVIYQNPEYTDCDITESTEPIISINTVSGIPELIYVNSTGTQVGYNTAYVPNLQYQPLAVIGSTFIIEDTYLFTCPVNNTNQTGQIWLLTYNEITKINTIKLIYNGLLNFDINYPIAPSAAIGRYELTNLQRIYWTDFNNPVRGMNVKDSNVMVLTSGLINLIPSSLLSVPILTNLLDGQATNPLNTGINYQCAYRLVKANGGMTNYSTCSNIVYPIAFATNTFNDITGNFAALRGYGALVNKALEFTVEGIDTNYDTIEFVIIQRAFPNPDDFTIYKYETQVISGQDTIKTVFRNPNDMDEISLQEFLLEGTSFTHCKTLESKDNRLFFGNIRDGLSQYLDTYDTRAYRFSNNSSTARFLKYENDSTLYSLTAPNYSVVEEKWDAIPAYNLGFDAIENPLWKNDKYQANSGILGGSGINISYKFGSRLFKSDVDYNRPTTGSNGDGSYNAGTSEDVDYNSTPSPNKHGFRVPGKPNGTSITGLSPYFNGAPNQTYVNNNTQASYGYEYFNGTYKSYQHNEIYRFGILFRTKSGKTSFVKWIGDIKFPDYSDTPAPGLEGRTNSYTPCMDFRSVFVDTIDNSAYNVIPYIHFDVNIPPALAALIDGFEIVRVQRKREDSYIKAHGMLNFAGNNLLKVGDLTYNADIYPSTYTFEAFTHIVDGYNLSNPNFNTGNDKIKFTEVYGLTHGANVNTNTSALANYSEYHGIYKYYSIISFFNSTYKYTVNTQDYIDQSGNNGIYFNYWQQLSGPSSTHESALGSPTIHLTTTSAAPAISTYGMLHTSNKILAIHYDPTKLASQYSGRKYINRTTNEYISTGAFYPIDVNDSGVKSIDVFGGDIYHSIVDVHKNIRNWGTNGSIAATDIKKSFALYFPVQSIYNIDLRDGSHVNRNLNAAGQDADLYDAYDYLYSYSYENNIKKFYPEPIFFNNTDEWNNRVFWSAVKINGETSDSWTSVPVLNYYDVEGAYGGINAFSILNNKFYFIQDRALGYLYINPITTITGGNGLPVTLGKGDTVEKHEYISIDSGSKHQWSVYRSSSAITFVDSRHKKIYLFNGQSLVPISDIKGAKGFINKVLHDDILENDNPIIGKGILVTYDHFNNEFLYTFRNTFLNTEGGDTSLLPDEVTNENYTLAYSELIGAFSAFYDFTPYIYINNRNKLYSLNSYSTIPNKIWRHNTGAYCNFYGVEYPSKLSVVINPNPLHTKVYDNISWISNSIKENIKWKDEENDYFGDTDDIPYLDNTITRFRCYNEYQNSDWLTLTQTNPITNLRRSEQGWNIQVPRNKVNYDSTAINTKSIFDPTILTKLTFGDRIRDKYIVADFEYDNDLNNRFIIHNIKTTYRISDR